MAMMNMLKFCIFIYMVCLIYADDEDRKVFIVYMGSLPEGEYFPSLHHSQIVQEIVHPSFANKSLIRSYSKSFNGFAAYLSKEEHQKLSSFDGVISVFPSQKLRPQTTRSWDFMGLSRRVERNLVVESDIIIGVIDYGIWPESESFNDEGFGPIPKKWKGQCAGGKNFTCNKKIIGARSYVYDYESMQHSARDENGHGTHVASIAAGNEVIGANYYGLAQGIARGGVPSARIAVYKACGVRCSDEHVMAAFEDAIADGVDIICISLGTDVPALDLTSDAISIGSFHAMEKDILTVNSAGNSGPSMYTALGHAPWILSVAASYTDRRIVDKVRLGDGTILKGDSINGFSSSAVEFPLVYGKEVTRTCSETNAMNCLPSCFESSMIKQKVVLCDTYSFRDADKEPSAFGYIIPNDGENVSFVTPSPLAALSTDDINLVKMYKNSTNKPMVKIFKSETMTNPMTAGLVASFSSRGPVKAIPDIVKPDVTAPGVEILAAFSPMVSPSGAPYDKRPVKYSIVSGTSMAAPHVAGAAAFVKSFHPKWSASAIKSALMTTAWNMNPALNIDAEFAYGSGHIDPIKATDPGLVYETFKDDYLKIWCNMPKRSSAYLNTSCPLKLTFIELNYPSMGVQVDTKYAFAVSFPRTVTNVGQANSRYVASIKGGSKLDILVEPNILQFTSQNQKMSFVVTVKGEIKSSQTTERALLLWTDAIHQVRTHIVVHTMNATSDGEAPSMNATSASTAPKFCKTYVVLLVMVFYLFFFEVMKLVLFQPIVWICYLLLNVLL